MLRLSSSILLLVLAGCMVRLGDSAQSEGSAPPAEKGAQPGSEPVLGGGGEGGAGGAGGESGAGGAGGAGGEGAADGGASGPGAQAASGAPVSAGAPETIEEKHVSRSAGVEGGVTVFWPRIIPREIVDANRDLGAALQRHVRGVVERALPGRPIDFRPEPERVCPKGGCKGPTVGLLLSRRDQGCIVLALISKPGEAPTKILPWAGSVTLRADMVPFREYPEQMITVADYIPCSSLLTTMDRNEAAIAAEIKRAAGL